MHPRNDAKYPRAEYLVAKTDLLLRCQRPDRNKVTVARRLQCLRDLKLPFAVVRTLNARVVVQRALRVIKSDMVQAVGLCLLKEWTAAEDPAHHLNHRYRYEYSDIYRKVSQRTMTKPFTVPTNKFRGRIIDLKPSALEKGRLFDYGLDLSDDNMDTGIGSMHEVPGSGRRPSEFSQESDDAIVPELRRALNEISSDTLTSSFLDSSVATAFYDSRLHDVTASSQASDFDKGVAEALDKYSYPMVSTPRPVS